MISERTRVILLPQSLQWTFSTKTTFPRWVYGFMLPPPGLFCHSMHIPFGYSELKLFFLGYVYKHKVQAKITWNHCNWSFKLYIFQIMLIKDENISEWVFILHFNVLCKRPVWFEENKLDEIVNPEFFFNWMHSQLNEYFNIGRVSRCIWCLHIRN